MGLSKAIEKITVPAPAKINLFLAITGRRPDDYHQIQSVISKIDMADYVTLEKTYKLDEVTCICEGNHSLSGEQNLAYSAVREWRQVTGDRTGVKVTIQKNIPIMAGLGGGSSDAVSTLLGLNSLNGNPLGDLELSNIAQKLGSDCAFFLTGGLAHVAGRGEDVHLFENKINESLNLQRLFIFQPPIGFSTPLLYERFSEKKMYSKGTWAKNRIQNWSKGTIPTIQFLYNDFESVILNKYLFLSPIFKLMEKVHGLSFRVSGSGSCCFCFAENDTDKESVEQLIKESLGDEAGFWETRIDC
jgi:4-diphosphocytidyl-2-C-methyl-D-erythritol kinase